MKHYLLSVILITTTYNVMTAQTIDASLRIGLKTNPASPIAAASLDFKAHGFAISPELIVDIEQGEPANFGIKLSYERNILDNVSVRAGTGYFYQLYTTDKYDIDKNGYAPNYFFSAQWKKLTGTIEYMDCIRLSIGVREKIADLIK